MKLKNVCLIVLCAILCLFHGCTTSKGLQKSMRNCAPGFGYEMRSSGFPQPAIATIVLQDVGAANMDYVTVVKKKNQYLIPLIFYNYSHSKFHATLGEQSMQTPFRNFFLEALYSECERFSFELTQEIGEKDPESVYFMNIRFNNVNSQSQITYAETVILWFGDDLKFGEGFLQNNKYQVGNTKSKIVMEVDVFKGAKCIFHKNYDIAFNPGRKRTTGDIDAAAAMAMNMMAESLSEATREITENLAQELNFLIIGSERAQK